MAPEAQLLPLFHVLVSQDRIHAVFQRRFVGGLAVDRVHVTCVFMVRASRSMACLAPDPFADGLLVTSAAGGMAPEARAVFRRPADGCLLGNGHGLLGFKRRRSPGMGRPEPLAVLVPDRFRGMAFGANRAADEGALFFFRVQVHGCRDDDHRDEQRKEEMPVFMDSHNRPAPVELSIP